MALAVDSKSAGRWNTNSGGEYYACGIGSSIAGRGADLAGEEGRLGLSGHGWQRYVFQTSRKLPR